jgi:hypothetical protein
MKENVKTKIKPAWAKIGPLQTIIRPTGFEARLKRYRASLAIAKGKGAA